MDQGLWATWYDLPEADSEAYLAWLHEDYLPSLLRRPGYAWAAHYHITGGGAHMQKIHDRLQRPDTEEVPTGTQYLVLVGAASPHVFFNPAAVQNEQREDGKTGDMLALRSGARTCIFCEEVRVNGPEYVRSAPGSVAGPAIQMGSFRTRNVEHEYDLGAWYAQYRLPAMGRMPGCIRTRKLVSAAGWAKHSILYEFTSLEARQEHFQDHESLALDDKVWTSKIIGYTIHAPGSPSVGSRIWPPVSEQEQE
jgi:hypothetical protein